MYYKLLIRKSIVFSMFDSESGVLLGERARTHKHARTPFFSPSAGECHPALMM